MKNLQHFLCFLLMITSVGIMAQKDTIKLKREARSLLRKGNDLYKKHKFTDASVAYKKALGKNSNYEKASYNLGNALYQEKNYKEAIPQYELSVKTAKTKVAKAEAYHNIGNAMMEQKQYQPAVNAYKNALRNNPNDDETRYNLAVAQKLLEKEKQNNKNDKNKNKDQKDNKDKNNKNKDKENKEGDNKDKKDDKKEGKGDNQKDQQNQNPKDSDQKDKEKPKPQKGKMSPQQVKQLLESLNNEEKKTQKKMNAQKSKGRKIKQEKDW